MAQNPSFDPNAFDPAAFSTELLIDASHNDVVVDDVINDCFIDSDTVVVIVPVEGEYDLDVGTPGHPKHRTAFASTRALELAYWQPGSPYAPYDVQPLFVMKNHLGYYAFSDRGVPQGIEDQVFSFEATLKQVDPLSFRSTPIASTIIGSIGTFERSQGRVVISDPLGIWAKKIHTEAITHMAGGLFWLVKGLWTQAALVGTIGRFSYKNRELTLFYGDFRRKTPTRQVIISV